MDLLTDIYISFWIDISTHIRLFLRTRFMQYLFPVLSGRLCPRWVPEIDTHSPSRRQRTLSHTTSASRNDGQPWTYSFSGYTYTHTVLWVCESDNQSTHTWMHLCKFVTLLQCNTHIWTVVCDFVTLLLCHGCRADCVYAAVNMSIIETHRSFCKCVTWLWWYYYRAEAMQ